MWTKDDTSEAPKVIFTPGEGDCNPCITRVVFDPEAPTETRVVIYSSGISAVGQSAEEVAAILGVG